MKRRMALLLTLLLAFMQVYAQRPQWIRPSATFTYAVRDSQVLKLDIYNPTPGSQTTVDGIGKPTILYLFGGGFAGGRRSPFYALDWIRQMNEAGYRVVSSDYRLGLKGLKKILPSTVGKAYRAVDMAVEDTYDATAWLLQHADSLGWESHDIVICGSSAGAVTSLQCAYELCNGMPRSAVLPQGFRYAGVMSWSGALVTRNGKPKYASEPPATLFFHGTDDKVVRFGQFKVMLWGMVGPKRLVREFDRNGYTYHLYRYQGHNHEVATIMAQTTREQFHFLEDAVMKHVSDTLDRTVNAEWLKVQNQTLFNIWGH